jgi:hypothetical protein
MGNTEVDEQAVQLPGNAELEYADEVTMVKAIEGHAIYRERFSANGPAVSPVAKTLLHSYAQQFRIHQRYRDCRAHRR